MKSYNLISELKFGKFKGLTLERIYVGRDYLTQEEKYQIIKEYSQIISQIIKEDEKFIFSGLKLDMTNTLQSFIECQALLDIEEEKEHLPTSMFIMDRINGGKSYIEWCILTLDHFCVNPDDLNKLEQLDYIICQNIEIIKFRKINLLEYDIDFKLNTIKKKSNFTEQIKKQNIEKYYG